MCNYFFRKSPNILILAVCFFLALSNSIVSAAPMGKSIKPIKVSSISLNKKTLELKINAKYKLSANILPSNATNKGVKWNVSPQDIVSVDKNGLIIALKPGKATITATTEVEKKVAYCTITVVDEKQAKVSIPVEVPDDYLHFNIYKDDTYMYYTDFAREGCLFKKNIKTQEESRLNTSHSAIKGICDKWIYFSKEIPTEGSKNSLTSKGLYRIDKNGDNETFVFDTQNSLIYCDNSYIYYQEIGYEFKDKKSLSYNRFLRVKHDRTDKKVISENFFLDTYSISNNIMYYYRSDKKEIVMLDLVNLTTKTLVSNISLEEMISDGTNIYYTDLDNQGKLYKIQINSLEKQKISDSYPKYIKLYSDYICFLNSNDNYKLYKVKIDGTNQCSIDDKYIKEETKKRIHLTKTIDLFIESNNDNNDHHLVRNNVLYQDYKYFIGDKDNCLYRKKSDNSGLTKLSTDPIGCFQILNDYIYYSKAIVQQSTTSAGTLNTSIPTEGFYRMNLDGTECKLINNYRVNSIELSKQSVFFSLYGATSSGIYYLSFKDEGLPTTSSIPTDGFVNNLTIYENYIFYIDSISNNKKVLYRMDLNGSNKMKLCISEKINDFIISKGFVIIELGDVLDFKNMEYKKAKLDGSEYQSSTKEEFYSKYAIII